MSAPDSFLLELFREELSSHAAVLTEGLLTLEGRNSEGEAIEPLMRAAHSIKGAARVVDLMPVVKIAHQMEDVLVAAGAARLSLGADDVDVLLGALDWMVGLGAVADGELPAWLERHGTEAEDWARRIEALLKAPAAIPAAAAFDAVPVQEMGIPEPASLAAAAERLHVPPEPPAEPASSALPSPAAPEDGGHPDQAVKVTAETMNQLLAYAAETLLEARRLEPLARGMQSLKRLHRRLSDIVDGALAADPAAETVKHLLSEMKSAVEEHDTALRDLAGRSTFLSERLYNLVLGSRMRPFSDGVQGFPRLVRDVARQLGKQAQLDIVGQATRVDRDILAKLDAPLNHLLRNALDHGLETPEERLAAGKPAAGRLRLEARHRSGRLVVSVSDDGRGIDLEALRGRIVRHGLVTADMAAQLTPAELYDFLFLPGLSTRDTVSEISGRGVGLDVVQTMVHACGGSLQVNSEPGAGTRFELQLPVTRSVVRALRVDIGGDSYALPLARIDRALRLPARSLESLGGHYYFPSEHGHIALVSARTVLALEESSAPAGELSLVLIGAAGQRYALEVDALLGECELVVRPLDPRLGKVPNLGAAAVDEQGAPILILDVDDVLRSADRLAGGPQRPRRREAPAAKRRAKRVLVVDDSLTVREVERKLLENHGYEADVAVDGMEGWNALRLQAYDLVISDVDMPRMNGIELVRRIKADPRLGALPVVIVSYKDRPEDRLRGMEAGADYYLTKSSFHDASLIRAVHDLIGGADES
jgi:two-component system sensor histidine kinase and response regulator WspE